MLAELEDMAGTYWVVRNVALLFAACALGLGWWEASDWALAWPLVLAFALFAKVSDSLMYRSDRPKREKPGKGAGLADTSTIVIMRPMAQEARPERKDEAA